ncbi:MAG TPA: hypothetical protein VFO71_03330, partial [Gemmatimonadales bacterium]|nr:hypothetical protein [Gemmatimonadales bacterium]
MFGNAFRKDRAIPKRDLHPTAKPRETAYLVAAELKHADGRWRSDASLEELALLADTAGARVVG